MTQSSEDREEGSVLSPLSSFSSLSSDSSLSRLSSPSLPPRKRRRKHIASLRSKQKAMVKLHKEISSRRYLSRGPYRRYSDFVFDEDMKTAQSSDGDDSDGDDKTSFLNEREFLQKYRMRRDTFGLLQSKIENHAVFKRKSTQSSRGRKQQTVAHQLMVFLHYIGTEGSGSSDGSQRNVFRKGAGTPRVWSRRVCRAIIECLEDDYYYWPDEEERAEISERIRKEYYFPNCVGLIDGTLTPLAFRPETEDAPDYKGRKGFYSLSMLVVCDDNRRITYYLAGWPGSAHDNRIFRNSRVFQSPEEFFSNLQYLLGDSAYECQIFMVPAYRKPAGIELERNNMKFNQVLSKPRVESEHCIGMLKGRFPWMRSIRMKITEKKKYLTRILNLIKATVILHNFLIDESDPCLEEWECKDEEDDSDDLSSLSSNDELNQPVTEATARRTQLRNYLVDVVP